MNERPRRSNAGSRMSKLIEEHAEEEDDEFYNTMYGGFNEEDDDAAYLTPDDVEEDVVDSDFSLSEQEDEATESADEEKKKRRKPVKIKTQKVSNLATEKPRKTLVKRVKMQVSVPSKRERMRASTLNKSEALTLKQKGIVKKHPRQPNVQLRRLTQQELLAEAKITEQQNLASLAQFLKLEEEKKSIKINKVHYQGPLIRYQSLRSQFTDEDDIPQFCTRNFLEFTDSKNFPRQYFPPKAKPLSPAVCVVTGLAAKYRDPLTGLPYATLDAFKYIREHRKRIRDDFVAKHDAKRKKRKELPTG